MKVAVENADVRGVVVELYTSATGPTGDGQESLVRFIEWCHVRGVIVVGTTWLPRAGEAASYESSAALRAAGLVFLPGILPEVATVRLMWALAQPSHTDIPSPMRQAVAGEFGVNLDQIMAGELAC